MRLSGVAVIIGGWVIAVAGLFITASALGRTIIACLGIGVSLYGILGILNGYNLERAICKK